MTSTLHPTGIARRENGAPPPKVPLGDIDLGLIEFWDLERTYATEHSRRCDASRRSRSSTLRISPGGLPGPATGH